MAKINILPKSVFNRISAGEVVDRPYSVVKELVENSIDSGAKNITINIEKGGKQLIQVEDDGCGIDREDLLSAYLPHATSKICNADDLYNIQTLGFRGEALASISSVAGVKICSKTATSDVCYEATCNGGEMSEIKECSGTNGTIVSVHNLFFNTPAREKFMKSDKAEESDTTVIVSKFILSNPDIYFEYYIDGKIAMRSFGNEQNDALLAVYGMETLKNCHIIDTEKNGIHIKGYISKPSFTKANRTYQSIFLNGRYINNSTISSAITNAYSSYLMKRQYPFYVLYITIPPQIVDVNVHPSKNDVRFANNQVIYGAVYSVISSVLDGRASAIEIVQNAAPIQEEVQAVAEESKQILTSLKTEEYNIDYARKTQIVPPSIIFRDSGYEQSCQQDISPVDVSFNENKAYLDKLVKVKQDKIDLSFFEYKGSLFNTYLIYEKGDDAFLIDQHAAHERLIYDKLKADMESRAIAVQPCLVPFVLNLNQQEFLFLQDKVQYIRELGFDIDEFGTNTYKISAIPVDLQTINLQEFFNELVSDVSSLRGIRLSELLKDKIAMQACKSAVKGGMMLSKNEIDSLFALLNADFDLRCPHGRPVAIKVTKTEIEKLFKRII